MLCCLFPRNGSSPTTIDETRDEIASCDALNLRREQWDEWIDHTEFTAWRRGTAPDRVLLFFRLKRGEGMRHGTAVMPERSRWPRIYTPTATGARRQA